jgi:uncharacterized protein (UPF0305 family)
MRRNLVEELDATEFHQMKNLETKDVHEITEKDFIDMDYEKLQRAKQMRYQAWLWRKKQDENWRDGQDIRVCEWLKAQYERDMLARYFEFLKHKSIEIKEFESVRLVKYDGYCWYCEIQGVKGNTTKTLCVIRRIWC